MTEPQTIVANRAPLTGSQRVALSRQRKRKDIVFVGVEILPTERDALIRIGLLKQGRPQQQNSSAGRPVCMF
jgi:hypothetical protein